MMNERPSRRPVSPLLLILHSSFCILHSEHSRLHPANAANGTTVMRKQTGPLLINASPRAAPASSPPDHRRPPSTARARPALATATHRASCTSVVAYRPNRRTRAELPQTTAAVRPKPSPPTYRASP